MAGGALLLAAPEPSRVIVTAGTFWDGASAPRTAVRIAIEDGKVVSVSPARGQVPQGARQFDFASSTVVPAGFALHRAADEPPGSKGLTIETRLADRVDPSNPEFMEAARLGATAIVYEGFTQSTVGGIASVQRPLNYWSNEREVVRDSGLTLALKARTVAPRRTAMEAAWEIRKLLLGARDGMPQSGSRPSDPASGTLVRLLGGSLRAQVHAPSLAEVARAVSLAEEFGLSLLLTGVRRVPNAPFPKVRAAVLLAPAHIDELPETWSTYQQLRQQDVAVGILSTTAPLPTLLALSRSIGRRHSLSDTDMLYAFTAAPAKVLGAASIGTLSVGQSADFLVISGKLFDPDARIERAFIQGREVFDRSRSSR